MHCMCQAHHAMTIHGLNPRGRKSNACADLYHQNNSCWKHRWGWGKRSWCVMMCLEAPSRSLQRHGYARNRSKKCAVFCPNCYDCITRLSDFDMTFSHLQQHAKVVAPSRSRQILDSRCDCGDTGRKKTAARRWSRFANPTLRPKEKCIFSNRFLLFLWFFKTILMFGTFMTSWIVCADKPGDPEVVPPDLEDYILNTNTHFYIY